MLGFFTGSCRRVEEFGNSVDYKVGTYMNECVKNCKQDLATACLYDYTQILSLILNREHHVACLHRVVKTEINSTNRRNCEL